MQHLQHPDSFVLFLARSGTENIMKKMPFLKFLVHSKSRAHVLSGWRSIPPSPPVIAPDHPDPRHQAGAQAGAPGPATGHRHPAGGPGQAGPGRRHQVAGGPGPAGPAGATG